MGFRFFVCILGLFIFSSPQVFAEEFPGIITSEEKSIRLVSEKTTQIISHEMFQAFAISDPEGIQLRFFSKDQGWTDWQALALEEEGITGSELLFLKASEKVELRSGKDQTVTGYFFQIPPETKILASAHEIDLEDDPFPKYLKELRSGRVVRIKSRVDWGADENLTVLQKSPLETAIPEEFSNGNGEEKESGNLCGPIEKAFPGQFKMKDRVVEIDSLGNSLIWPLRYSQKVKKIVIHHTAQSLRDLDGDSIITENDYLLAVRAIYSYHTVSRKWGDIGYHYLVDPSGNLYEGKAGGKDVIGAHVLCQNTSTIGVAVMGNFEIQSLPEKAYEGLVELVTYLSEFYDINPLGKSMFRGTMLPHIVTHAEIGAVTKEQVGRGATQCPGIFLKDKMVSLRTLVAQGGIKPDYAYSVEKSIQMVLKPLQRSEIAFTIKNIGQKTWTSLEFFERNAKKSILRKEGEIPFGGSLSLSLPIFSDLSAGPKNTAFRVLANGKKFRKPLLISYSVEKPIFSYSLEEFDVGNVPLLTREQRELLLRIKNTGNFPWLSSGKNAFSLRQVSRRGKTVTIVQGGETHFISQGVNIGEIAIFKIRLPEQKEEGIILKEFLPVVSEQKGLKGEKIFLKIPVEHPRFEVSLELDNPKFHLKKGSVDSVDIAVINKGNFPLSSGDFWIFFEGEEKEFFPDILSQEGALLSKAIQSDYDQGEILLSGSFGMSFQRKKYRRNFELSIPSSGIIRLNSQLLDQSTASFIPKKGRNLQWVELKNTGNVPWYLDGEDAIVLRSKGNMLGIPEQEITLPGESVRFSIPFDFKKLPQKQLEYRFTLQAGKRKIQIKGGPVKFIVKGKLAAKEPSGHVVRVLLHSVTSFPLIVKSPEGVERAIKTDELHDGKIIRMESSPDSILELASVNRQKVFGTKTYNDNRYRGILEFRQVDGAPAVINELSLKDYLKGIAEEPESSDIPQEKRKVIAVLSRSYALHYLISGYEKFPGKPYQASDDPAVFQKYLGYSFEERSPKWQQALKDTEGEVLMVDSSLDSSATREERILRAAYFSCTDGDRTKTPEEAGWSAMEYFKRFGKVFIPVEDPLGDDPSRQGFKECGHQVGLSGYGATQMAKQGKNYREIMAYYYQHIAIESW